jgi:indole-3-glycerol phosphate synthase
MSDFLATMAQGSRGRCAVAREALPEPLLRERIGRLPPPPPLVLSEQGFDLILEFKLRSPAQGPLPPPLGLAAQLDAYAEAGACAVSVLTEPERFDGSLAHLEQAARLLAPRAIPALRKDFLVDRYQLLEARLAGAGGVLLIVRMLDDRQLAELLSVAAELKLFVLLECFDAPDIARARTAAMAWARNPGALLIGLNCRDLVTLAVQPERLLTLAAHLPREFPRVAESGVATPADAARLAGAGYSLALVGSALMASASPGALGRELLAAGRAGVRSGRARA